MALVAVTALTALVAAGVTLGVLQFQSRTNTQQVNLRAGVTIVEESAIVQVAAKAKPAVVSVVTQQSPQVAGASGYLVTTDGYIVTNVSAIAGATALTVLLNRDANLHTARPGAKCGQHLQSSHRRKVGRLKKNPELAQIRGRCVIRPAHNHRSAV